EKTAEAFLPNPFATGETIYKTGDRGRYRADGSIDFLGREDNQVKIRGIRVELGEIENVLNQHQAVKEAVVITHEHRPGDKRLIGYVVPVVEAALELPELRAYLKSKLPEYMVPAVIVPLALLPLNANSKVDRRALPLPDWEQVETLTSYVAPRNPVEELVAQVWSQVMQVEIVGINENFFDVGGHSLLATQVVSRIRRLFQIELPVSVLFEAPTVEALAVYVQAALQIDRTHAEKPIVPVARERALPLSFAQQRMWFLEQMEPGSSAYNVPSPMRLQGHLDVDALQRSIAMIVQRHESLRTTFTQQGDQAVQLIAADPIVALTQVNLLAIEPEAREAEIERLLSEEINRSFHLEQGPLFRTLLLRVGELEHILVLNMHHIITDGWSMDLLRQELSTCYQAFVNGESPMLPELPIQYADYACWQRDWLQGEVLEQQIAYWKQQLGGELPILQLKQARPRPEQLSHRGERIWFEISESIVTRLQALSQQETATLFMTLLASYHVLLYRFSGIEDSLVGTPIANRNRHEIERVMGVFTNTLVLRNRVSDELPFRELVRAVRSSALEGYAHQDLPFEKLVEELHPDRQLGVSPFFQVWFVLLQDFVPMQLAGLTSSWMEISLQQAKWDLSLEVIEQAGGYRAAFDYKCDLFERSLIERIVRDYLVLLEQVATEPDICIRDLFAKLDQEEDRYKKELQKQLRSMRQSEFRRNR
ncbi:MAG: condensation domain-containing protein, partial [Tumebacillaceae bacterium]